MWPFLWKCLYLVLIITYVKRTANFAVRSSGHVKRPHTTQM